MDKQRWSSPKAQRRAAAWAIALVYTVFLLAVAVAWQAGALP